MQFLESKAIILWQMAWQMAWQMVRQMVKDNWTQRNACCSFPALGNDGYGTRELFILHSSFFNICHIICHTISGLFTEGCTRSDRFADYFTKTSWYYRGSQAKHKTKAKGLHFSADKHKKNRENVCYIINNVYLCQAKQHENHNTNKTFLLTKIH